MEEPKKDFFNFYDNQAYYKHEQEFLSKMQKLQQIVQPDPATQKAMDELSRLLQPDPEVQKTLNLITDAARQASESLRKAFEPFQNQLDYLKNFTKPYELIPEELRKSLESIARHGERIKSIEDTGWLPHYTIPLSLTDGSFGNSQELYEKICKFSKDNWISIKQKILSNLKSNDLDDECLKTFEEAFNAHENGLYRCVSRLLFPEIERTALIRIHASKLGILTSQHTLRDLAGNLSGGVVNGYCGFEFYKVLDGHLYEYINSEASLIKFKASTIPNRHAALHGLISYNSFQNSLNMIFIADVIIQMICAIQNEGLHHQSSVA